jgi:outer membrane protein TolC
VSVSLDSTELSSTGVKYQDLRVLTSTALTYRQDYLGAKRSFDASSSGVTMARAGYFPSLSARAGLNGNNETIKDLFDFTTMYWGVSLSWTLFDGFATNQSIQNAVASHRNAEITIAQAERDINVEVRKDCSTSKRHEAYEVSQKGLLSASEDPEDC